MALIERLARFALPGIAPDCCRAFGRGLREIEMLGARARDARAGRLRLPLDELARAHAAPQTRAQPPWAAGLAALVRERHRQVRAALAASVAALASHEQAALRGLLVWAALACGHSRRAERALPGALPSGDHPAPLDAARPRPASRSSTWNGRWPPTTTGWPMRCSSATGASMGCCTTQRFSAPSRLSSTTTCRPGAGCCTSMSPPPLR